MSTARPLFQPEPPHEPAPPRRRQHAHHRWARILSWIAGFSFLFTVLSTIAVVVLLNSRKFHEYVLSKAQSIASENLGARVQLQNYALNFSNLSLDVYGVTVHGANPYPDPPLLQLQHAEVGVRIVSLLQKKWYLSDVRLDHPVVQIFIDKNGVSNIPKPKSSNKKSNTNLFDLGIRHAILDQGEIYYNAQKSALSADLHDVDFQASYNPLVTMYSGNLAYTNGQVLFGTYRPFVHNFDAQFDYTPTTFQLHHATLTSGASKVNLAATATNLNAPDVQAKYEVGLDGSQFAKLMNNASIPAGFIKAAGTAHYRDVPDQPLLETLTVNGDLTSPRLLVQTSSIRAAVENLAAHYSLAHGDAVLHDLRAGLLGGEVTAEGTMKQIGGNSRSDFAASLRNISLGDALQVAGAKLNQPVRLTGVLNADAKAGWGKTMDDLVAKADASIHGTAAGTHAPAAVPVSAANAQPAPAGAVPIDSEIHATYTGAHKQLALDQSYLHTPQTSLTLNGVVSNHSSLALQLQANDLRELATIASFLSTPKPGQQPQPLNLAGKATFQGTVQGSTAAPHLTGQLNATGLRVNGSAWRVFRTNVDASPSQASLRNADLEPEPKGRIAFNATTGLKKWAFTNTSPIQVDLDASQLNVADLVKMAGQQVPVTGTLNTHVSLHGTELNPVGNGNLSLINASAYNEPIS